MRPNQTLLRIAASAAHAEHLVGPTKKMKQCIIILACLAMMGCTMLRPSDNAAHRLAQREIPEVGFNDTPFSDVVQFIANEQFAVDLPPAPAQQTASQTHVIYLIPVPPSQDAVSTAPFSGLPDHKFLKMGPNITFSSGRITLYDLLIKVVRMANGTVVFTDSFAQIEIPMANNVLEDTARKLADPQR